MGGVAMTIKFGKRWGETCPLIQTPLVEVHRITAKAGMSCSTHKHEFKFNAFYVISGTLRIEVEKNDYPLTDTTTLEAGDLTTVRPNEFHRFVAETDVEALEIYYLAPIGDDIVRRA
jgi:mannose-6-phosphate isomerase-like protein (cupin superfamily)